MTTLNRPIPPDRTDCTLTLLLGLGALAVYVRTLAPDLLYGDSAEFQTLAYTLGMTHSTGYPTYLLLARLIGFVPFGTLAWRVNLVSALGAAGTVSAVFLSARHLTRSRLGPLMGSIAFGISYTFWSQAIIAEVYTPAAAFLGLTMLLMWRWHSDPRGNGRWLLLATALAGLGLGVHLSVAFILPPVTALLIPVVRSRRASGRHWRRYVALAFTGLGLGSVALGLTFLLLDANDPPSSFHQVTMFPSRSIWGLAASDLDEPAERIMVILSGRQWQNVMFAGGTAHMWSGLKTYVQRLVGIEFSLATVLCALLGLAVSLRTAPRLGVFLLTGFATGLVAILNYEPPDKYIFYLPTYLFLAVAGGAGAGHLLGLANSFRLRLGDRRYAVIYPIAAVMLTLAFIWPFAGSRWRAIETGAGTFVEEHYAYPLEDLEEPRRIAARRVSYLADDALLALDWRALYTTFYVAHVERGRTAITIKEAAPYGSAGRLSDTLIQELTQALNEGRPVYADRLYRNLREHFRAQPVLDGDLYRLSLPLW